MQPSRNCVPFDIVASITNRLSMTLTNDPVAMDNLPTSPGTYALHLYQPAARTLKVGKLGEFELPCGDYVYLGSAFNPGGLKARLGRHLCGGGNPHWHIDYLRAAATVLGYHFVTHDRNNTPGELPLECQWSQMFSDLPGASYIIPGFGASDCREECPAHLVTLLGGCDDSTGDAIRNVLLSRSYSYKLISCHMR